MNKKSLIMSIAILGIVLSSCDSRIVKTMDSTPNIEISNTGSKYSGGDFLTTDEDRIVSKTVFNAMSPRGANSPTSKDGWDYYEMGHNWAGDTPTSSDLFHSIYKLHQLVENPKQKTVLIEPYLVSYNLNGNNPDTVGEVSPALWFLENASESSDYFRGFKYENLERQVYYSPEMETVKSASNLIDLGRKRITNYPIAFNYDDFSQVALDYLNNFGWDTGKPDYTFKTMEGYPKRDEKNLNLKLMITVSFLEVNPITIEKVRPLAFNTTDNRNFSILDMLPFNTTPYYNFYSSRPESGGRAAPLDCFLDDKDMWRDPDDPNKIPNFRFTDEMRGVHRVHGVLYDSREWDKNEPGIATLPFDFELTVEDTSPPEVWVVGGAGKTAEESRKAPFYVSLSLIGETNFIEASIRSSLRITDHGIEQDPFKTGIWIQPLGGIGSYLAIATAEDDLGNSGTVNLEVKVVNNIPGVIAVNNSYLIASPQLPVLASSDIDQSIRSTAEYGDDKTISALTIDNETYQNYAQNSGRVGNYKIKYQITLSTPGADDEILDKEITVKVLAVSIAPQPKTDWEKFLEWIRINGNWLWPVVGAGGAVLVGLAVWANWPKSPKTVPAGASAKKEKKK